MPKNTLRKTRPFLFRAKNELPTLLFGIEAPWNQMQLLQHAIDLLRQDPAYLNFAADLAFCSWQHRPLDKSALQTLVSLQDKVSVLPAQRCVITSILNKHVSFPEQDADIGELLVQANDGGSLPRAFLELANDGRSGLFWLGQILPLLLDQGLFAQAAELMAECTALASFSHIGQRLRAEWAMAALPPAEALSMVDAVDKDLFGPWRDAARASLLLQQDPEANGAEAAHLLGRLWQRFPWHVNLALTTHELLRPPPSTVPDALLDQVSVLLYSWNKASDLAATLESLAASRIGRAKVICLDNGSTDETPQVLQEARDMWRARGLPPLDLLRLPVNIGAPAARNWLLSLPQVRESRYMAFLDDDIFLPPDWLPKLVAQAEATPRVSAVGCRVERNKRPHLLQAADFNLLNPELCNSGFKDVREGLFVCNNGLGLRDSGLLRYTRACVSVTGCCHVLPRESVARFNGFDIRFSPSQFDDLERDLRAFLSGFTSIYHGSVVVRHVQYSSLTQARDNAKKAHVHGNKLKLEHLFEKQDIHNAAVRCRRMLDNDFTRKVVELDAMLPSL